jgi:hypothetical protein
MESIVSVYWIKILATLVVFGALVVLFVRQGRGGASKVGDVLSVLDALGEDYVVLNNVVVPAQHGMSRIKHVVVSPYGVFVITVNTDSGRLMGEAAEREWLLKNGFRKELIYNPLWANRKHANALERVLGPVRLFPLVVLIHARMKGTCEPNVIRLRELKDYIGRNKTVTLSEEQRGEIIQKLTRP